jgi:integrase
MVELEARLRQYPTVQRWLRDKSAETVETYVRSMNHYTQHSGLSPEQFAAWAKTVEGVDVQDTIDKFADDLTDATQFNFKIAMRSFLKHQGFNNLPKSKINYTLHQFHRGYKPAEAKKLLSYLDDRIQKLYVTFALETGFRSKTILAIKYRHVAEDFEAGVVPCAVRLEPKFYTGKKSAGYTFIGERGVALLKECIKAGLVQAKAEAPIFPVGYAAMYDAVTLAHKKAGLDPKIQPSHGLRKTFENGLDASGIDHEQKMMIEGHFVGARGRHYTDREFDNLRPVYAQAYPHLDVEGSNPELEKKLVSWDNEKKDMQTEITELKGTIARLETMFKEAMKKKKD